MTPAIFKSAVFRAVIATIIAIIFLLALKIIAGSPIALEADDWAEFLPIVFIATFLASLPNGKLR